MIEQILSKNWTVFQTDDADRIPAEVPGNVHLDLLRADRIPDPFYRDNEEKLMWIGKTDWVYQSEFDVDPSLLKQTRQVLRFEGLDTVATVTLNGTTLGRVDNMFRVWEFDVKAVLQFGANHLRVLLHSPFGYIEEVSAKLSDCCSGGVGSHRLVGNNFIRKEPCNFGWDWGPMCVTCGIWRPARLLGFSGGRLDSVRIRQNHEPSLVRCSVDVTTEMLGSAPLKAQLTLRDGDNIVAETAVELSADGTGTGDLQIDNPKLWWPNGLGEQHLYHLQTQLKTGDGTVLDTRQKRIGLRTVELVREDDAWGESFRFHVNSRPFFAKGANWIPTDVFQCRATPETYRNELESARDTHMNMIRVWGGGIYEEDAFYDLCDELGLLVWQDFMFACAAYPVHQEFLDNVRREAVDNVRRIRHHACIALWCGNNELEQCAHVTDDGRNGSMTWEENAILFDELIPQVLAEEDPERPYWPSSAHQPRGDRANSQGDDAGDAHLWEVWHGQQPFEWYRTSFHRFCSEFGFQSFPEPHTVRTYTVPEDRNVTTRVMELHQRSNVGNTRIIQYMLSWYRMPVGFENTVWLSQIQQGLAMKYAVEHWRRNMPRCMGALYWQLNDCWQVASWASLDYFGRWKALQYMARRFFAPLLVSGVEHEDKPVVDVHVTCDELAPRPVTLAWTVTTAAGETVDDGRQEIAPPANASQCVKTLELQDAVGQHGKYDLLVWLELLDGDRRVSADLVTFVRPKHLELPDPQLSATVTGSDENGNLLVRIDAQKSALWTWLELTNTPSRASDNFFCLRAGQSAYLSVTPETPLSPEEAADQLRVRSLYDTYQE